MDLPGTTFNDARSAIEEIAVVHNRVFNSLSHLVSVGIDLTIVPGNHDVELTDTSVFSTLCDHIDSRSSRAGTVHLNPWMYYVPGLIYAEHGNQYHDVNWFSTLLSPTYCDDGDRVHRTSARWLKGLRDVTGVRRGDLRTVPKHIVGLTDSLRLTPSWAMPREVYLTKIAIPYGDSLGIDADTVRALDAITSRGPAAVVRRFGHKTLRRLWTKLRRSDGVSPSEWRDRYLLRSVSEVVAVTTSHGMGVPSYVFGHTHVAGTSTLHDDSSYINIGTWSAQLPTDRASDPAAWFTFAKITRASADLMRWDDDLQGWTTVDS